MRIALLTRSYPADDDLYKYPFVHRRVLAYLAAGHSVQVMRLSDTASTHVFEGVECRSVAPDGLAAAIAGFVPDVVAIHGPDEVQWPAICSLQGRRPVCAWLHGSEIPGIQRVKAALVPDQAAREAALILAEKRASFWRSALDPWPGWLRLTFPSRDAAALMCKDLNLQPTGDQIMVLPNPIDTVLFPKRDKLPDDALRILSIRPHDSWLYANDLAVQAVLELQAHPRFAKMRFTFVGDGPLFDETFAPLRHLPNVTLQKGFMRQEDIPLEHARHGVFLVPSRLDTQGVSRDEAMSSGLVPVTTRICAIPEFVDDACAGLAEPEDAAGLANEIARMIDEPALFVARSRSAAARVRMQSSHEIVIPHDLKWMREFADAAC